MDSSPSISKTQTRGGIPKPSEKKFGKYRVLQIRREISAHRYVLPDFVDCYVVSPFCRAALVWVVKGKEAIGIWSHAHVGCSYYLPPTPTFQSLLLCVCVPGIFFRVRELTAVKIVIEKFLPFSLITFLSFILFIQIRALLWP